MPRVFRATILLAASTVWLAAQPRAATAYDFAALMAAAASITDQDLQSHADVLADDQFEGREAGTRGGQAAGTYLMDRFQQRGLTGGGDDGGYFQLFGQGLRNVLGVLEGSAPELKQQFVVIGAHYDHVGYGSRTNSYGPFGYVHNGADDNASGVAGLLEVLDAFLALPDRPARSVLFACWDGEEKGLLGSKHWTAQPTVPLEQVAFAFNVDMIGRMQHDKLEVYGSRTSAGLRRLVSELNSHDPLDLDFTWEMKANSDHFPLAERQIPVLMFHTGLHDDYHRPSDDTHLLNAAGMRRSARLLFQVAAQLAHRSPRPAFRSAGMQETPALRQELEAALPALQPRFGVRWETVEGQPGVRLSYVQPGLAASDAELQVGDQIVTFHGQPVTDSSALFVAVLAAPSPVDAVVRRPGHDGDLTVSIPLRGQPTRVGIAWRWDDAEPGTAVVSRVATGSAADAAGIAVGDRVYELNGHPFASSAELFDRLSQLPSPLRVTVERHGRLREVTLDVPAPLSIQ